MFQISKWKASFTALLALIVCLSSSVFAQSDTAAMTGIVRDQTGGTVPGATVLVRNEATGLERRATTNADGYYIATNLPPGFYTVSVEASGFKRFESKSNKLDANVNATVDVPLTVGQVTETVEVTAAAPQVQSDTATVGRVVTTQQIEDLPLNGRNPLLLAQLKAGVRRTNSMAEFTFGLNSGGFAINGSRSQDNLITFDGAPAVRTRSNGDSIGTADVDTIQEIQILTANYNAEYGRSAGGQIRMVTKSGSQDFHGAAYDYFRNDKLDANSWTRNRANLPRETRRYNQFGYNLSGPVYIPGKFNSDKSKLFFLWSQEWVRFRRQLTEQSTVPSLAMRQGNFSELLNPANPFFGRAVQLRDPATQAPIPNNIIPESQFSRNGMAFVRMFPLPTQGFQQGTNNFIQTRPQPENQRKDTVSIDLNATQTQSLRFRFQNYNYNRVDAFRERFDFAVTTWDRPNRTASLNHIWTISPNVINEALVTGSVDRVRLGISTEGDRYNRATYGIDYPYIYPEGKVLGAKIPTVSIANFQTIEGSPYPGSSAGPIYTLSDSITWINGTHSLKFGGTFERSGQNDFDQINVTGVPGGTTNQNGRFVFADATAGGTGLAIANAAVGIFDTYAEIGPRAYTPYRGHMFEWFVQDSWKATDKLRIEAGVRWTYQTPYYYSLWNNISVFDPNRYDPARAATVNPDTGTVTGNRYNGIVIPGSGFPEEAIGRFPAASSNEFQQLFSGEDVYPKRRYKTFAPRFGLAYQINEKTAFRAGGGRFIARVGVSDEVYLGGNPPFQPTVSITGGNVDRPGGGTAAGFPQFIMTMDPEFKYPEAWNWSATVERQIGWNNVVTIGYVGRVGLHLERVRDINALAPGAVQANPSVRNAAALRPYKGFAQINLAENAARSEYNGLQIELNRRFTGGFSYGFAYTYSKSEDNASDRRAKLYNNYDDRNYWGPSTFDTRHVAVANVIYEFPWLRGNRSLAGYALGGWQVSMVAQFQTGSPNTLGRDGSIAGVGVTAFEPWEVNGEIAYDKKFSEGAGSGNYWLRVRDANGTALVTQPAPGTFSRTQTRNLFYGPGFQNWNLAAFKVFQIAETHRVELRGEAFNFINHPNLGSATAGGGVTIDPASSTFGMVTGKWGERNIQLSLRYQF